MSNEQNGSKQNVQNRTDPKSQLQHNEHEWHFIIMGCNAFKRHFHKSIGNILWSISGTVSYTSQFILPYTSASVMNNSHPVCLMLNVNIGAPSLLLALNWSPSLWRRQGFSSKGTPTDDYCKPRNIGLEYGGWWLEGVTNQGHGRKCGRKWYFRLLCYLVMFGVALCVCFKWLQSLSQVEVYHPKEVFDFQPPIRWTFALVPMHASDWWS